MRSPLRLRTLLVVAALAAPQAAQAQETPLTFTLAPEVTAGVAYRANDAATGYPMHERGALGYRAGLYLGIGKRFDVGLLYQHSGIGIEKTTNVATEPGIETRRTLDGLVLEGRYFAWRNSWAGLFLGLQLGLGWQGLDHTATRVEQPESLPRIIKVRCSASGGPGLGLGANLGGEFDINEGTSFLMLLSGTTHRLSSDTLQDGGADCADGAGSSSVFLAQIGFRHRFDLGGSADKKAAR
jgi:hypothetical protein